MKIILKVFNIIYVLILSNSNFKSSLRFQQRVYYNSLAVLNQSQRRLIIALSQMEVEEKVLHERREVINGIWGIYQGKYVIKAFFGFSNVTVNEVNFCEVHIQHNFEADVIIYWAVEFVVEAAAEVGIIQWIEAVFYDFSGLLGFPKVNQGFNFEIFKFVNSIFVLLIELGSFIQIAVER